MFVALLSDSSASLCCRDHTILPEFASCHRVGYDPSFDQLDKKRFLSSYLSISLSTILMVVNNEADSMKKFNMFLDDYQKERLLGKK